LLYERKFWLRERSKKFIFADDNIILLFYFPSLSHPSLLLWSASSHDIIKRSRFLFSSKYCEKKNYDRKFHNKRYCWALYKYMRKKVFPILHCSSAIERKSSSSKEKYFCKVFLSRIWDCEWRWQRICDASNFYSRIYTLRSTWGVREGFSKWAGCCFIKKKFFLEVNIQK
jgi:hypothetical protein